MEHIANARAELVARRDKLNLVINSLDEIIRVEFIGGGNRLNR